MPAIKKEPGTEESPFTSVGRSTTPKGSKRKNRSDHPETRRTKKKQRSGRLSAEQKSRVLESETWKYITGFLSRPLRKLPAFPRRIREMLELPRKRDLPIAWKTRLASAFPVYHILRLLIEYLTGDAGVDVLCSLPGSNCREKWEEVCPAMASLEEGKEIIYKAAAFPMCVRPAAVASSHGDVRRMCCNAYYRDSRQPSMPAIWSPRTPAPVPPSSPVFPPPSSPASSSSSPLPIKKEPGTESSPIAQDTMKTKNSKRKKRSDSPSVSGPRKKQKQQNKKPDDEIFELQMIVQATETWQYISRFTPFQLTVPKVSKGLVKALEHPRKRDLPMAWKRRLALEKPNRKITRLLLNFLTGDDESNSFLCSLPGANCRQMWMTVSPAIDSLQQGKLIIYKDGAFPRCVLFESFSGKKRCCNAVYRGFDNPPMPDIWSPPAPAPALVSSPVSSSSPSSSSSSSPSSSSSSSSTSSSSRIPSPVVTTAVERVLPEILNPETPRHQIIHEAPAQQETGFITSLGEQRNEAMNLSGPGNASTSYAHSAGWLQQRQGQVLSTGIDGSTLQILDLQNTGTTTPLASDFQNLSCIVFEGTVEVILQDVPVFTISRGGHWAVGVGKECRVRNPRTGSKAVLYIVGMPAMPTRED